MAYIIDLTSHADDRGTLTAIDNVLPFKIARLYYIKDVNPGETRGRHRHFISEEAVICQNGAFIAHIISPTEDKEYHLNDSDHCLIITPGDWHEFYSFAPGSILLGISSTSYDKADYDAEPLTVNS